MKKTYLMIGVMVLLMVGGTYLTHNTQEVVTITVTDKDRIMTGSGETLSSKYLVFTEGEVFENEDALSFGKFNSSDIQGQLRQDSTYKVKVAGFRIQWLSSYRNIIEIVK